MQLGFAVPLAGSWATPEHMVTTASRAEELGYVSLWTFQRLLCPADPATSTQPQRWGPTYRSVHDPLVTLAYLAAHTRTARLGVAVLNMPWFSPLLLAKQASTLDAVSTGRLDLGLGLGWADEEYAATGAPRDRRGARADAFVETLRAIWTQDVVEVDNEFHQVHGVVAPRPVQRPHPPVLLGGGAEPALRRAGRLADGWISSSGQDLREVGPAIETVRTGAREAGRDPDGLRIVCRGSVRVRPGGREGRRLLSGSYAEIRADLAGLAERGVTETFLDLNFDPHVATPEADPHASVALALELLEEMAP